MSKKEKDRLLSDAVSDEDITHTKKHTAPKEKKPGMMDWLFKPAQGYKKTHTDEHDMDDKLSDDEDNSIGGPR